jgi:hypothetical protein
MAIVFVFVFVVGNVALRALMNPRADEVPPEA